MLQVEQMAIVIAILCHELELEINNDTVLTHAEAACRDLYGPGQGSRYALEFVHAQRHAGNEGHAPGRRNAAEKGSGVFAQYAQGQAAATS